MKLTHRVFVFINTRTISKNQKKFNRKHKYRLDVSGLLYPIKTSGKIKERDKN